MCANLKDCQRTFRHNIYFVEENILPTCHKKQRKQSWAASLASCFELLSVTIVGKIILMPSNLFLLV